MIITGCGKHLYQIVPYFDNRHIEGSSSEIVDKNFLLLSMVQSVCECRRGWLIYDSKHIKPSNLSCILSCLPLRIRKICRNCDYGVCHCLTNIVLCILFQLSENHRRNLRSRIQLSVHFCPEIASHLSLY